MKDEKGNAGSPIWLIGDSTPKRWENDLEYPLDERHPVIHNIWTPIIYRIQKRIYQEKSIMIDMNNDLFYIRNAVTKVDMKPGNSDKCWQKTDLNEQLMKMKNNINKYDPQMLITFGAFAFEFVRRCSESEFEFKKEKYGYWGVKKLRKEFIDAITDKKKIVPLLHVTISRRSWRKNHINFTNDDKGNYFDFTADRLYKRIMEILKI